MPAFKLVKNLKIPGVEAPKETCKDPNCPWHGTLRVRGLILEGLVERAKAKKMAVVRHEYLYYSEKYMRYERRMSKIHAHVPECIKVEPGQKVVIGECRPIAKTVKFVVLGVKG